MSKLRIINILYADEVFEAPSFLSNNPFYANKTNYNQDYPKDLYKSESHSGKLVIQDKVSDANT